jgi:hypothetical protein
MAKKRENKNRSYREMIRNQQKEMDAIDKRRRETLEKELGVIMIAFSLLTLLLVVLAAFDVIGQLVMFIWTIAMMIYAFCCIVGYIKAPDNVVKKVCIVISSCTIVSFIATLAC